MYKSAFKSYGDVDNKDEWFRMFKEKCVWDPLSEKAVQKVFNTRCSKRMSDMLRRVRENYELHGIRPSWIGEEVFQELVIYWRTPEFRAKSETFKKIRASEKDGCVNTVGSISTAEHARRLAKQLGRRPLMPELISRTRTRRSGGVVDDRTRMYLEEYDRRLAIFLENNPQFMPAEGEPLSADVDHYIWCEVIKDKGPNGCFFGAGNLASNYRSGDRNLFQRVQDGEGGSRQPNLTQEQTELIRQMARHDSEAQLEMMRKRHADMEEQHARQLEGIMKKQAEMEEQMRQFMQGGGNYSNVPPQDQPEDDGVADDFNPDNYFPDDGAS